MITLIGTTGAGLILAGFLLNQFGVWKNDNVYYDCINALGSALLVWYAYLLMSIPFLVLNAVWFASAAYDVVKYFAKQRA